MVRAPSRHTEIGGRGGRTEGLVGPPKHSRIRAERLELGEGRVLVRSVVHGAAALACRGVDGWALDGIDEVGEAHQRLVRLDKHAAAWRRHDGVAEAVGRERHVHLAVAQRAPEVLVRPLAQRRPVRSAALHDDRPVGRDEGLELSWRRRPRDTRHASVGAVSACVHAGRRERELREVVIELRRRTSIRIASVLPGFGFAYAPTVLLYSSRAPCEGRCFMAAWPEVPRRAPRRATDTMPSR